MSPALRRTRGDVLASAAIAATALALVGGAYATAPIRSSELTPAPERLESVAPLSSAPQQLAESFRLVDDSPGAAPLIAQGLIISYSAAEKTLSATTPTGATAWTYRREVELCSLGQAWGKVVATYRDRAGCGDVVAIDALSGQYAGTRAAVAPDEVRGISSNDRVGTVSASRVELWRSDLVRTVEYGRVEAPQEADFQPHQCEISSALTRKELLAVTETCADGTWLRLLDATPEDSRKPEIHSSTRVAAGSFLLAVSPEAAAIYDPAAGEVRSFGTDGAQKSASPTPPLDPAVSTADLPHHMTAASGGALLLFRPGDLSLSGSLDGALGTGCAAGDRVLVPIDGGLAVTRADTPEPQVERVIAVDRGGDEARRVGVAAAGEVVVEKRGNALVALSAL
ncbi:hypothetical protein [Corynebacterium liangguodongii]|uniref:Uncharacterized protein n=1 Tax=Corynebacterium liangguodongii TaxID=2079535 RepID=A0A2S0WCQ4_9CORY|nr:hypothetical protein [Corynebacterium liangguodongii]AWB83557.1 hypothetical protein C3E79_02845 [Corynebacterium liangguodongii]PWC00354.1 hypothetical protein DF219_00110 [Corynebacterium liangguodongii]